MECYKNAEAFVNDAELMITYDGTPSHAFAFFLVALYNQ